MARSGNPKPPIDPEIAQKGEKTRFGQPGGPDPVKAVAKSNAKQKELRDVRAELRYLSVQPINLGPLKDGYIPLEKLDRELTRLQRDGNGETNANRLGAVRLMEKMIKTGDIQAINSYIDNVSGKLSQEIVLPPAVKAPLPMTLEEAEQIYKEHMRR